MSSALTSLIRVFPELVDLGSCVDRSRRRPATMQAWGAAALRCGPPPSVSSPGQLLWAVLDWLDLLFDWLFWLLWLPDCWPCPPPG